MPVYIGSTSGYMRLDSWVLSKVLQLGVNDFCRRYFNRTNDPCGRQFDQTTQAARAVPANIAEGSARHQTSYESEMKLLDVARASLSEVIDDMTFILLDNGQTAWANDDPRARTIRAIRLDAPQYGESQLHDATAHILRQHSYFAPHIANDDPCYVANVLIIISLRVLKMLRGQLEGRLDEFKEQGGFREQMTETRLEARREQSLATGAPTCPKCGAPMVTKTAKAGTRSGTQFWGCSNFPQCDGTRPKN